MPLVFLILAFFTGLAAAAVWMLTGGTATGAAVAYVLGGNSILIPLLPMMMRAPKPSMGG